jgi:hypothetical protein
MNHLQLLKNLNDLFGKDWLVVEEPETLHLMFEHKGMSLDDVPGDLIQSLRTLFLSNLPWEDPWVFENIVDGLNNNYVLPTTYTKPPIEDIMYAVYVMRSINPKNIFSGEIESYIAAIAVDSQMILLPQPLSFVNHRIPTDDAGVQNKLTQLFTKLGITTAETITNKETPLDIQLLRILRVKELFEGKVDSL